LGFDIVGKPVRPALPKRALPGKPRFESSPYGKLKTILRVEAAGTAIIMWGEQVLPSRPEPTRFDVDFSQPLGRKTTIRGMLCPFSLRVDEHSSQLQN